jgi:xanthine dehydrogenase molybdenum-binding subunit
MVRPYESGNGRKRKIAGRGCTWLGLSPDELDTKDCFVFAKNDPEKKLHWSEILGPLESVTGIGASKVFTSPNFFIIYVEVEVDLETGKAEIIKT